MKSSPTNEFSETEECNVRANPFGKHGFLNSTPHALIVSDVTLPGGVSTHIIQLVEFAEQSGWRITVLLDTSQGADSISSYLEPRGTYVERFSIYHGNNPEDKIEKTIKEAFARHHPDIVHVICGSIRSAVVIRETTIREKLPLLFTEQYVSPATLVTPDILTRIRCIYEGAHEVIFVCRENRKVCTEHFGLTSARCHVIPNAIKIGPRKQWTSVHPRLRVLCVARLTQQKGIDILIKAMTSLSRQKATLTIAGDGDLSPSLREFARSHALGEDIIRFTGWCDNVPHLLDQHELFVLPSRSEGQPFALLEALALGLPCIATDTPGASDVLCGGAFGELIPIDDPVSLESAILRFLACPEQLREKALRGQEHLRQHHNPEVTMRQVVGLWNKNRESTREIQNRGERA